MQFNNTATSQGIFQEIDFLCNTDSATFTIADKTRAVNKWQDFVVAEVLDSMDEWDFQGTKAYTNLVANQQAYAWATEILKIKRVEIDYDGNGDYIVADQMDISTEEYAMQQSADVNDVYDQGDPRFDAWGNSAILFPVPDTSVNSGLVIWHTDNITEFTATAAMNTAEPDFNRPFHSILSYGATLDYARKFRIDDLIKFTERELYGKDGLVDKLRKHYGTRSSDKILSVKSHYYDENYA